MLKRKKIFQTFEGQKNFEVFLTLTNLKCSKHTERILYFLKSTYSKGQNV